MSTWHTRQSELSPDMTEVDNDRIESELQGKEIHGFKFSGFEAHGGSILWSHKKFGLYLYATPEWADEGTISVALVGGGHTLFQHLDYGVCTEALDCDGAITIDLYLEKLKSFIENQLYW